MNKKRGFTLIEIIVAIALIAVIGTTSVVGVTTLNKKIKIAKLEEIEDQVIAAAEIYIETNKETHNQLYKQKNGVIIPLKVLSDTGLLTLENTNLKESDIEDEYVVTALTNTTQTSTNNCIDIRTETSWKTTSSAPIYICTDNEGNSNLAVINPNSLNNQNTVTRERFYFRGGNVYNWIKLKGTDKLYRIYYVDTDDSLVLFDSDYSSSTTPSEIKNNTLPILDISGKSGSVGCDHTKNVMFYEADPSWYDDGDDIDNDGIVPFDYFECYNLFTCNTDANIYEGWITNYFDWSSGGYNGKYSYYDKKVKIHIKPCMKITSGTGDFANPYILEDKC